MLKLKKAAVTGGLSSGKSSVCRFFKELGACVVNADEIVHKLLSPDTSLGQAVVQLIGHDIVVNDRIDRSKIATKVFKQPKLLQSLENILHPAVFNEIERHYREAQKLPSISLFVAEVPLLFESGGDKYFDVKIAVVSNPSSCVQRFVAATGHNQEEYENRMARQLSPEAKAEKVDYVIYNNGTLGELKEGVLKIYNQLVKTQETDSS